MRLRRRIVTPLLLGGKFITRVVAQETYLFSSSAVVDIQSVLL